jgi:acyl-CoA thioesterase
VPNELLETIRARAGRNSFWTYLGVQVDDAGEGWIKMSLPLRDELRNAPNAPVHGGVYASLIDMAVGGALATTMPLSEGGTGQATLDLNVSFLSTANGPTVYVDAKVLKRGRSIFFGEASITDSDGRLVAVGRATYMLLPPPKA